MAALVEQDRKVVVPADRREDEIDLVRNARRRAERAWGLARARLEVEHDAGLGAQRDPEPVERPLKAFDEPVRGELPVEIGRAHEPRDVGALKALEPVAERSPQRVIDRLGVPRGGGLGEGRDLVGETHQVNALAGDAQLAVTAVAELPGGGVLAADQLCVEVGELGGDHGEPSPLEDGSPLGVRFVGLDHRRLPEAESLVVDVERQRRFAPGEFGLGRLAGLPDVPLDGKVEQHPQPALRITPGRRGLVQAAQTLDRGAGEQLGMTHVQRLDLVGVLQPCEVPVLLAGEVGEKRLGGTTVGLKIHAPAMLNV